MLFRSAWGSLSCSVVRNTACRGSRPGIGTPVSLESTRVFDVEGSSALHYLPGNSAWVGTPVTLFVSMANVNNMFV